jgi:outer membrane protein assembly factor BamB
LSTTPTFKQVYINNADTCGISSTNDQVFALDTQPASAPTGVVRALFPLASAPAPGLGIGGICFDVSPAPVLADRMLFIGSDSGYIYALDTDTLMLRWQFPLPGDGTGPGSEFIVSTPAIAAGMLYVTTFGGSIPGSNGLGIRALAYTAAGAHIVWSSPLPWRLCAACALDWAQSSPTVANGLVYVGGATGLVYAFEAATGALKWAYKTFDVPSPPTPQPVCSRPAVAEGIVYVAGGNGVLYALNAASGGLVWSKPTGVLNIGGGHYICGSPAVANGAVYFVTGDGHAYAFDARTGQVRWQLTLKHHTHSSVREDHGTLYIGTDDGALVAIDATRPAPLWEYMTPTGAEIDSTPAVDNGTVYFGARDGWVYAINARACAAPGAGALRWKFSTTIVTGSGPAITASPGFGP